MSDCLFYEINLDSFIVNVLDLRYAWRTTEWTECRIDPLLSQQDKRRGNQTALCGGGIQTREVYCVQANENLLSYLNTLKEKEGMFEFLPNGLA